MVDVKARWWTVYRLWTSVALRMNESFLEGSVVPKGRVCGASFFKVGDGREVPRCIWLDGSFLFMEFSTVPVRY